MLTTPLNRLRFSTEAVKKLSHRICCGYAAILFTESPRVGLLFLTVTFWFPTIGASGLIAVLFALLIAHFFKFRNLISGLHIYNSLLVGLSLGSHYALNASLVLVLFLSSILTVFCCVIFSERLWLSERLPALSIPL